MSIMHARVTRNRAGRLWLTARLNGTSFPSWLLPTHVDPQIRGILQPMLTEASAILERNGIEQVAPWETDPVSLTARVIDFRAAVTA